MERDRRQLRKRSLSGGTVARGVAPEEIDLTNFATLAYSSEHPSHPVDHLVDGCAGAWRNAVGERPHRHN